MFKFAILTGIYSYLIFALGLLNLLYRINIMILTFFFFIFCIALFKEQIKYSTKFFTIFTRSILAKAMQGYSFNNFNNLSFLFLSLICIQSLINLIGVLGPELGFDALWYHLTLPKIYLINHSIFHIPGGLLYYSDMPKLGEMLYISALAFNGEILSKLMHFAFGILSCIAIYKLSRKFLSQKFSLLAILIFYSNLVVAWESIAAYVDLTRAFFEILTFWGFIEWRKSRNNKWLIKSALMLGLAISVKLISLGSLPIFIALLFLDFLIARSFFKKTILNIFIFSFFALIIPFPWFVFSLVNTGNPFYPLFTNFYRVGFELSFLNPLKFVVDSWSLFINSPDPVSPIYLSFLPLMILFFTKLGRELRLISAYSLFALFIWYITPQTGGGRFILPYLPALSIVAAGAIDKIKKDSPLKNICIFIVIISSLLTIFYRTAANSKYIPVLLGRESKTQFLSRNLNFSFGDFYDTDRFFKNHIKSQDKVLLYGFHNLYYVDFSFIDSSWIKKGDRFNYIAVQNGELPKRFSYWELIYQNQKTHVKLYSMGGKEWVY